MLDLLFPRRCMLCEKPSGGLCTDCVAQLVPPRFSDPPGGLQSLRSICSYEGAGRELVLALKRGNRRDGVAVLGSSLAETIDRGHAAGNPGSTLIAGVTWAPTTARRRRERGFDQSELLARAVGRHLGVRVRRCMRRTGEAQMGLGESERRSNPAFSAVAMSVDRRDRTPGRHRRSITGTWILVDDVVTTGATMEAAAVVLRGLGADAVIGAAIATTP